jgi:hypothetical protein
MRVDQQQPNGRCGTQLPSQRNAIGKKRAESLTRTSEVQRAPGAAAAKRKRRPYREAHLCYYIFLFFLFKLVVVDKGRALLWTGVFFC